MGMLLAFSLRKLNFDISLFDFKINENCSYAAAGLLSPMIELIRNDPVIFKLGTDAINKYWPDIITHLESDIYFEKKGSILLGFPQDYNDVIHSVQRIKSKLNVHNFYSELSSSELENLEPELSKFNHGYYFSNEAQLDNQALLHALQKNLLQSKVKLFNQHKVSHLRAGSIEVDGKTINYDFIFDCRGLGAKDTFDDLRGVRGELIWLLAPDINLTRPIHLMHPRYNLYIAPRPDHYFLLGASEIEATDFSPISLKSTLELLSAAYSINSKFAEARVVKTVTQCRPTLFNHLPKIKYTSGLMRINGLYRHGFLISPSLVNDIVRFFQTGFSTVNYPDLWEKQTNDYNFLEQSSDLY